MRLNPECIRDILICVEDNTGLSKGVGSETICDLNPQYSKDEIIYHIRQCKFHKFIFITVEIRDSILISDLTPLGHEFLADTRSNNVWNKTKSIATKVGSNSLAALAQIASGVVTNLISNQF